MRVLLLLALVSCTASADHVAAGPVPEHPFLADAPWPMSHASPYSRGSVDAPGLPDASSYEVDFVATDVASVTLAVAPVYPDGTWVAWGSTALSVYKLRLGDPLEVLASLPGGGGLGDLVAGAYTMVDDEGVFYATASTSVRRYREAVEGDPLSAIEPAGEVDLGAGGGSLRGLGMTWDGAVIVVSSTGRVVALTRELEVLDELTVPGEVSNSVAIDETGGIYVVSSAAMRRVQWTGVALSLDPADGAWEAAYEVGDTAAAAGGRLGTGSGSTPSLMDVGDDRLVVITDAQPLMHVVAFWRDAIPEGWVAPAGADPRVAGLAPVTFGDPSRSTSRSEQSALVMGDGVVIVNNDYGDQEGIAPVLAGVAPPGIERFTWDARRDTLTSAWSIPDLSCPNGIPSASTQDRRMYCVGRRGPLWTVEVIDWDAGEPLFYVPLGEEPAYNSTYAATEIGPAGTVLTGTLQGAVQVRATR